MDEDNYFVNIKLNSNFLFLNMQLNLRNEIYLGANKRKSLFDFQVPNNWNNQILIFIHGYMGYKDWGCWNLVQDFFVDLGFGFLKYNISHNGCTIDHPNEFKDLHTFAKNNYSNEVQDFESIISIVESKFPQAKISIIGHSRGGGIALLQSQHPSVQQIVSLAGIASIKGRFPKEEMLQKWENDGFYLKKNGRTNQQMPHDYSQYLSFLENQDRLNIEKYCRLNTKPTLIIHGESDTSVLPLDGERISSWLSTNLVLIPDSNHTFGSSEPWEKEKLPEQLLMVCEIIHGFLLQNTKKAEIDEKKSILSDLVQLAKSDDNVRESEFQFLFSLAKQIGINREDFKQIFEEHINFNPPKLEVDRIVQFQRLILMMNVDGEIEQKELEYIQNIGLRMGLNPTATNEILRIMGDYPRGIIPPDKLIQVFRTFMN